MSSRAPSQHDWATWTGQPLGQSLLPTWTTLAVSTAFEASKLTFPMATSEFVLLCLNPPDPRLIFYGTACLGCAPFLRSGPAIAACALRGPEGSRVASGSEELSMLHIQAKRPSLPVGCKVGEAGNCKYC